MNSTTSDPASPQTVVLIHGMWMTPLSWEHWLNRYNVRGHRVLAPAWPGLEAEPEELRRDPSPLRNLSITDVVDHYDKIIRALDRPPIIIGHSFGGLYTQLLLDRGLGAAGVVMGTGAPKGVLHAPGRVARLGQPRESEKGSPSDAKAIPLVLHKRAQSRRVGRRLPALLHPGLVASVLPGGFRELQPAGGDQGRLPEPQAAAAPTCDRY